MVWKKKKKWRWVFLKLAAHQRGELVKVDVAVEIGVRHRDHLGYLILLKVLVEVLENAAQFGTANLPVA